MVYTVCVSRISKTVFVTVATTALFTILSILLSYSIYAQSFKLKSDTYTIMPESVDIQTYSKTQNQYYSFFPQNSKILKQFVKQGYVVLKGFEYLKPESPFRFSVSNTNMFFTPDSDSFFTSDLKLVVAFAKEGEYVVSVVQPASEEFTNIPPTFCDEPSHKCTILKPNRWKNSKAYGIGYRIEGDDVSGVFDDRFYFRALPNEARTHPSIPILRGATSYPPRAAKFVLKFSLPTMMLNKVKTAIRFTAVPMY